MIDHEFLELMHTIVRQQSSAVLLADSTKSSELAMEALGNAGDVYDACRDMIALQSDETNYATAQVIARLDRHPAEPKSHTSATRYASPYGNSAGSSNPKPSTPNPSTSLLFNTQK